jgi:hypothetical protein
MGICSGSLGSHAGANRQDHATTGLAGHHGSVLSLLSTLNKDVLTSV